MKPLLIVIAFIVMSVSGAALAIQPQDIVGSWKDMSCTPPDIGGCDLNADSTFIWTCDLVIMGEGKWAFHPPDQFELISYDRARKISARSGHQLFRIERFAFRRLHLRGADGKETIWIRERKT